MKKQPSTYTSVDDYIAQFSDAVQQKLREMRANIRAPAPEAVELFSYAMPAFAQQGNLV